MMDGKIAELEARIATLEAHSCRCVDCQQAMRQRRTDAALEARFAIERLPDPECVAKIRAMSPSERLQFLTACTPERAIELFTRGLFSDAEITKWTPIQIRDRVELELVEIPARVRLRVAPGFSLQGREEIFLDNAKQAAKLQAAGLNVRATSDSHRVFTVRGPNLNGRVFERTALDALLTVDHKLREVIAQGHVTVVGLADDESKAIEAELWRSTHWDQRPKRPRKKRPAKSGFKLDTGAGFDQGRLS